ncbi:ROK family protein [Brachybacterium sp. NBEC-018]|uniref:ROK family transcriptional regulator n=1 Tax=Brachybacterium sp. NBEC-018 TaxID=2996004 RepID=UPI0021753CA9|nr:ROK family protein [Brachybacterium sp. NBEC-018]UVY82766.1 ROK family protein [Brachybacterium sp. NBEC-018]
MVHGTARSPRLLRRMNSAALLRFALDTEEFTAGEAMAASGLTRATVLGVCTDLVAAGWLEELADSREAGLTQRGRPARRYRLREQVGVLVGVDADEAVLRVEVCSLRGRRLAERTLELEGPTRDGPARRELVSRTVAEVLAEPAVGGAPSLLTVIGVPAPVDADGASPTDDPPFWAAMNPGFADTPGARVLVENDANLAALAEHAHRQVAHMAALLTGERFGAGLVVDGRLLRGRRGGAGEMRMLELLVGSDPDAGTTDGLGALARRWALGALARDDGSSSLRSVDPEVLGIAEVLTAAADGDVLALGVLRRLGERLARIVAVIESLLDVEEIVLCGADVTGIGPVLDEARTVLEEQFSPPWPELTASTLGREVVLRGAVALALDRLREDPLALLDEG